MNKHILTDADGCLVNWNKSFETFLAGKGFPRLPGTEAEYSIAIRHGISNNQAFEFLKEFNESEHIAELEAFADSVEYVTKLANLGFRFTVVTSISSHPLAKENRITNLKNLFGDVFDEVHCLEMGESKAHILTNWSDTDYFWIEDHMRQAEAGHEAGLKTVLINHPYNEHYHTDLFPRVSHTSPWKEIYEMVCKEYGLVTA